MLAMKKIFLHFVLISLFSPLIQANEYEKKLFDCRDELYASYSSNSEAPLIEAKANFSKLLEQYPDSFLVHYYTAQANLYLATFYHQNKKVKNFNAVLHEGLEDVEKCLSLNDNFADGYILLAQFYGYRIYSEGYQTAAQNNKNIKDNLEIAKGMEPDNPRIYLVNGINNLYTPQAYGGSMENAKSDLEKALKLYPGYKPLNNTFPNWGFEETYVWLGKIAEQEEKPGLAKSYYQKALKVNSNYSWAKYQLEQLGKKDNGMNTNIFIWIGGFVVLVIIILIVSKLIKTKLIN
jgi:hypothetical protein